MAHYSLQTYNINTPQYVFGNNPFNIIISQNINTLSKMCKLCFEMQLAQYQYRLLNYMCKLFSHARASQYRIISVLSLIISYFQVVGYRRRTDACPLYLKK